MVMNFCVAFIELCNVNVAEIRVENLIDYKFCHKYLTHLNVMNFLCNATGNDDERLL